MARGRHRKVKKSVKVVAVVSIASVLAGVFGVSSLFLLGVFKFSLPKKSKLGRVGRIIGGISRFMSIIAPVIGVFVLLVS